MFVLEVQTYAVVDGCLRRAQGGGSPQPMGPRCWVGRGDTRIWFRKGAREGLAVGKGRGFGDLAMGETSYWGNVCEERDSSSEQ